MHVLVCIQEGLRRGGLTPPPWLRMPAIAEDV